MSEHVQLEKRKAPRFDIDMPVTAYSSQVETELVSELRNISVYGLGVVMKQAIPIGSILEIVLMLPDKEDRIRLKGRIIWVNSLNYIHRYRVGIQLLEESFNPIPYVLKMLQSKARNRFSYNHPYFG